MYQASGVRTIENYYEDKFTDLEQKRGPAEGQFDRLVEQGFKHDIQYHLGEEQKRKHQVPDTRGGMGYYNKPAEAYPDASQAHQSINIESLLRDP